MVQPLRRLTPIKKYKGSGKLVCTPEAIEAFEYCQQAISNCQELYFLEGTATPILQTDAPDYGIGGYLFMVTSGRVRVVRFYSKALVGAQLNWSVREKECYGIFYGIRLFEDLPDNRPFILKTDHINLTYLNVTLTRKVLRWKLYLQDKDFYLCHVPGKEGPLRSARRTVLTVREPHAKETRNRKEKDRTAILSAQQPKQYIYYLHICYIFIACTYYIYILHAHILYIHYPCTYYIYIYYMYICHHIITMSLLNKPKKL